MDFEYDQKKSNSNKVKHGLDFTKAQQLWDDPNRVVFVAKTRDEKRYVMIARLKSKYWTAIYTLRRNKIRIISVRRARKEEVQLYES